MVRLLICPILCSREYWIIYRGPGFRMWFDSSSPPPSPATRPLSSTCDTQEDWGRGQLADGGGGRGWGRSQMIPRRESPVLYNSLNTPFLAVFPPLSECICMRTFKFLTVFSWQSKKAPNHIGNCRCCDVTEMGTNMSALCCDKCR